MVAAVRLFLIFSLMAIGVIEGASWLHRHRADLPWTELDLRMPAGRSTAAKIADLGDDPPRCRALLSAGGSRSGTAPDRLVSASCGYRDGVTLREAAPGVVTSCPVAAALLVWNRSLQSEAQRRLGSGIARLVTAGSFSCRRLYGREDGAWSEHATADAIDITGFVLADGRTLSVLRDWDDRGPAGTFLRAARDSACRSFTTVLSPAYNEAHRDHLHLDTADRGVGGWTACR